MPKHHRAADAAAMFVLHGRGHCEAPAAPALLALAAVVSLGMLTVLRAGLGEALFLTSASWNFVPGGASGSSAPATGRPGLLASRKDFVTSSRRLVGPDNL